MNNSNRFPDNRPLSLCKMKRDVSLDVIRLIACLMIVLMHSPMPGLGTPGLVLSGISYLTAPGIGLFFMVSGALLLKSNVAKSFETHVFLRKRFTKILIPLLFWSLVGWGLERGGVKNAELSILWFMYCLTGMYLLTPILYRWLSLANRKEVEFYLIIWLVTLCIPLVKLFVPMNEGDTSWLYYFHGYVGYYVLGFYLKHYWEKSVSMGRNAVLVVAFISFSVILPIILLASNVKVDFYSIFWYLSITVALQCVVWWVVVQRLMRNVSKCLGFVVELSRLSFGIYLIHILVMRNFLWKTDWMQNMNCIIQLVVCTLLTFTISAIISLFVSKIKYVRAIIGY